jgi:ATP-dependent Clp protease ATP-binding subunit ClpC
MFESFGAQARQVIVHAQQEARRLQHNWIGTEHLLLGVMDVGGSVGELLTAERVGVDDVRRDVEAIIGRPSEPLSPHVPFTPRSRRVLEHSVQEAKQLGQEFVGARHILLGLLRERDGIAAQVLTRRGLDLDQLRAQVIELPADHDDGEVHRLRAEIERLRALLHAHGIDPGAGSPS